MPTAAAPAATNDGSARHRQLSHSPLSTARTYHLFACVAIRTGPAWIVAPRVPIDGHAVSDRAVSCLETTPASERANDTWPGAAIAAIGRKPPDSAHAALCGFPVLDLQAVRSGPDTGKSCPKAVWRPFRQEWLDQRLNPSPSHPLPCPLLVAFPLQSLAPLGAGCGGLSGGGGGGKNPPSRSLADVGLMPAAASGSAGLEPAQLAQRDPDQHAGAGGSGAGLGGSEDAGKATLRTMLPACLENAPGHAWQVHAKRPAGNKRPPVHDGLEFQPQPSSPDSRPGSNRCLSPPARVGALCPDQSRSSLRG